MSEQYQQIGIVLIVVSMLLPLVIICIFRVWLPQKRRYEESARRHDERFERITSQLYSTTQTRVGGEDNVQIDAGGSGRHSQTQIGGKGNKQIIK